MGYNSILDKLVEKYPNAEGINDARNIAEAVAAINGVGGRGANAIADQFFAEEEGGGPIMVDLVVPELKDGIELTSGPSSELVLSLRDMAPSPDPALYTIRLVVTGKGTYTPPDYCHAGGDMAGQTLDVNFTVDGDPWCVVLMTREPQGAHTLRSGHFGTDPNS